MGIIVFGGLIAASVAYNPMIFMDLESLGLHDMHRVVFVEDDRSFD